MYNNLTEEDNDLLRRKFNVIEYAANNVYDRHRFNQKHPTLNVQVYHSIFKHTPAIIEYFNNTIDPVTNKNTLGGYRGEVWADKFLERYGVKT